MKIISPFKDFYDFKVAKYGIDPLLVYRRGIGENKTHDKLTRPNQINAEFSADWVIHAILWVGDELVHLFISDETVYSHFDLAEPQEFLKTKFSNHIHSEPSVKLANFYDKKLKLIFNDDNDYYCYSRFFCYHKTQNIYSAGYYPRNTSPIYRQSLRHYYDDDYFDEYQTAMLEDYTNIPILLLQQYDIEKQNITFCQSEFTDPSLQQLGIFLDPDFVWQALVRFLSRLKSDQEIIPEVANDDKIINKGFDIKHSFRPKMKKK